MNIETVDPFDARRWPDFVESQTVDALAHCGAYTISMPAVKNNPWQQHIGAELALLRASPQVQSVSSLEHGEVLLAEHASRLSVDELLLVLRV